MIAFREEYLRRRVIRGKYYKTIVLYRHGFSQLEISEILAIPLSWVKRWLNGYPPPNVKRLKRKRDERIRSDRINQGYPDLLFELFDKLPLNIYHKALLFGLYYGDGSAVICPSKTPATGGFKYRFSIACSPEVPHQLEVGYRLLSLIGKPSIQRKPRLTVYIDHKILTLYLVIIAHDKEEITEEVRKIVESSLVTRKLWLYGFKLSEGAKSNRVLNSNTKFLKYFKQLEKQIGIKTKANVKPWSSLFGKRTYQLSVPVASLKKHGIDTRRIPKWVDDVLPPSSTFFSYLFSLLQSFQPLHLVVRV